jgi:probable addiction module antidote protein
MPSKVTAFDVSEYLKDEASIAAYLNAIVEEGDPGLLLSAIGDIAKARGMSKIASESGLGRESLYKALSSDAKPRFDTILKVLSALGVNIVFNAKDTRRVSHNKIRKSRPLHGAKRINISIKGAPSTSWLGRARTRLPRK